MKETYKILIISEVQGYIIMSLKDKIKEAGYQVAWSSRMWHRSQPSVIPSVPI